MMKSKGSVYFRVLVTFTVHSDVRCCLKAALLMSDDDDDVKPSVSAQKPVSKIARLQGQVNEVIDDMKINIDKVIERGNNLDELNDRSEQLNVTGDLFKQRARGVRRQMWFRTCRTRLYLAITIAVVLILFICKSTLNQKSSKSSAYSTSVCSAFSHDLQKVLSIDHYAPHFNRSSTNGTFIRS